MNAERGSRVAGEAGESWRLEAFRQLLVRSWRRQLMESAEDRVASTEREQAS